MNLPFRNLWYISYGSTAIVLAADYKGRAAAAKLYFKRPDAVALSRTEFEVLKKLKGIQGVPEPFDFFECSITESQVGVAIPEKASVIARERAFANGELQFSSAMLFQHYRGLRNLCDVSPLPEEFFGQLEAMVRQVHDRGLSLPEDADFFADSGKPARPVILDWMHAFSLKSDPSRDGFIRENFYLVGALRQLYCGKKAPAQA
ncbi:hypothetical protein HYU16_04625 [Candidatus Woesearchaeota archaeon]|nr:hypothetical protein [Candidatus Woesearchaeota archaeon]